MVDLPPWKAREPGNDEAALEVLTRLWATSEYRTAVAEAFSSAESPKPHLYLSHVPDTSVWLSYVIDEGRHAIVMAYIDGGGGPGEALT